MKFCKQICMMSCQLSLRANFQDARAVRRFLFPDQKETSTKEGGSERWDDFDWGWKDETLEAENKESQPAESQSWLQECHVSLSPSGDLIVIANNDRIVHLTQKWESKEEIQMKYSVTFEGCIAQDEREKITCVLCLPLASQKRSTHGGPDWTCVIVGFNSGYVRMYTETGTPLLSQIFSEECVLKLKCRTYALPRHSADTEKHEELNILYNKSLVTIDGFSLYQSLKACRNQAARATASGTELLPPPPLAYKKWSLSEQEQVVDHVPCGLVTANPFDQMRAKSMNVSSIGSGFGSTSASNLYLTTGKGAYVDFFYTGGSQPILSDVAHAVATKLKSALFSQISHASGWLGFGRPQTDATREPKKPKIEPATALPARFGLYDKTRVGESIVPCPDGRLVATTDAFGRVILLDVVRGVAVRMWKGYRDAQVGWIEVTEDSVHEAEHSIGQTSVPRCASFLVIYAPRRGILEVWGVQHGPRVAAFSVGKCCRLVCPEYGLLGLNNVTCRDFTTLTYSVYLFDPDGSIKAVDVPFHLALSDKNSKRARDMHLLKRLKLLLKEQTSENESLQSKVIDTLLDIRIPSIRQQGLERVLHTSYISIELIQNVIHAILNQLTVSMSEQDDGGEISVTADNLDYDTRTLIQFCESHQLLLATYRSLCNQNKQTDAMATTSSADNAKQLLVRVLAVGADEAEQLVAVVDKFQQVSPPPATTRVRFACDAAETMTVVDFLSCFECRVMKPPDAVGDVVHDAVLTAKHCQSLLAAFVLPSLSESKKKRLASFVFSSFLASGSALNCENLLKDSHIPADNLLQLLLHFWLSEDRPSLSHVDCLFTLVNAVYSLRDVGSSAVTQWWHSYREVCSQSQCVVSALILALVARRIVTHATAVEPALDTELNSEPNSRLVTRPLVSSNSDVSGWESVVLEHEHWTLLVRQLEDLLAVHCLLRTVPPVGSFIKPAWEPEVLALSLRQVLDGGKGVVPEYVAKWISGHGMPPSFLCLGAADSDHVESNVSVSSTDVASKKHFSLSYLKSRSMSLSTNPVVSKPHLDSDQVFHVLCSITNGRAEQIKELKDVQHRLPLTLSSDILMANCAWEFLVIWNRDPEVIYALEQAVVYLKCVQNAVLQHGLATMIWQMFIVKKLASAAQLIDKVGKAPKDRLCRKEVGLSEVSLEKFVGHTVDLLETMAQARLDIHEMPVFMVEDLWQNIQGPTSLVELAVEQKQANNELVEHHYILCSLLHAVLVFNIKSIKPLSLFDTKGKNSFFKPLHSTTLLSHDVVDEIILNSRRQFLCRVISHSVVAAAAAGSASSPTDHQPVSSSHPVTPISSSPPMSSSAPLSSSATLISSSSPPSSLQLSYASGSALLPTANYMRWPALVLKLAPSLCVDTDELTRHHVVELYSSGLDKIAQEVLLSVNNHALIGSELLIIAGCRLAHFVLNCDPMNGVERLAKCSPSVSSWLQSLDVKRIRCASPPLSTTASLLGHIVNQLPEGHSEYKLALELVELIQSYL